MTPEQIENSKIIAEFMEFEYDRKLQLSGKETVAFSIEHCQYHTSWDWLMPVVEKICKYEFKDSSAEEQLTPNYSYLRTFGMIDEENGNLLVRFNRGVLHSEKTLIGATFNAVVDFIKWSTLEDETKCKEPCLKNGKSDRYCLECANEIMNPILTLIK